MEEYHKINAPFKRDNRGKLIPGAWCLEELEYLANNSWEFTEKVDGTNIRLGFELHREQEAFASWIGGRTNNADIPKDLMAVLQDMSDNRRRDIEQLMTARDIPSIVIFGEGYGPKINGGGKYRDKPSFVVFDVKVGEWWLRRKDVVDFAGSLGLDVVPVKGYGTLWDGIEIVRNGMKSYWGDFEAEGIVARPRVGLFDRGGNRIITKIKAKDFRSFE